MPNIYFLLFELIMYIQLALCLHHAWKQGPANLLKLFAGTLFGVTLELATIRQLDAHEYGRFLIMVSADYGERISVEQCDEVPPVSVDYAEARDVIIERLQLLLDNIRRSS